jgi:hypothetical protein
MAALATEQGLGVSSRNDAIKQLIENHQEEWIKLLGDARENNGLPRDPKRAAIERKIKTLEEQLAKERAKLTEA